MNRAVETTSQPRGASADDANTRRRLLRLVAGGVPLMAGPPAIASSVAASSAFRAAVRDGQRTPALVSTGGDRWIRQPVQVVRLGPNGNTGGNGPNVVSAYKVAIYGQTTRYYAMTSPYQQINLGGEPPLQESTTEAATNVMMLVLFDRQNFSMIPQVVDPTLYGQTSLQGLQCSSWSSIYPSGGNPLSCGV
jgi:hypothetical protein